MRPPSRETASTMSRMSPGKTRRQVSATVLPAPVAASTRQHTQVSSPTLRMPSTRVPCSTTRATQVAGSLRPSWLSIHVSSTVPSAATASPSNECEMGRSSFTRSGAARSVRPPSSERESCRSEAKSVPSGLGFPDDQDT